MREKQTKKQTIIESITNTLIGTLTSFLASIIVYPLVGLEVTIKEIGLITIIFTVLSIIKNFFIRRFFETEIWFKLWQKHKS